MKTIELDMTITAEQAHAAWESLDDSTPAYIRDAYFRRYAQRKEGMSNPVTYAVSDTPTASFKERPLHAPPRATEKPAARKEAVQPPAQRREIKPLTQKHKPKPASDPTPPAKPRSREGRGRIHGIPPRDYPAIHRRINEAAEHLGYGDIGFGLNPGPWGSVSQFQRKSGIKSQSTFHATVSSGKHIWPAAIECLHENLGINREWLLTGKGEMLWAAVKDAHFEPKKKPAEKPAPQSWMKTATASIGTQTISDAVRDTTPANWQSLTKRPPGGVLFDALVLNADQTFSIIGAAAFTSRVAA